MQWAAILFMAARTGNAEIVEVLLRQTLINVDPCNEVRGQSATFQRERLN